MCPRLSTVSSSGTSVTFGPGLRGLPGIAGGDRRLLPGGCREDQQGRTAGGDRRVFGPEPSHLWKPQSSCVFFCV